MSSESEESVDLQIERTDNTVSGGKDYARRRVSFQLDENGEVLVQVFGESFLQRRRQEELIIPNKVKLTFSPEQCDSVRLLQVRDELEKLTKTKEEIREWLSPLDSTHEQVQRAGLILHDGNFQPWFFGKITRRESEALLKDTEAGTFLLRLSEKTASSYTLSIRSMTPPGGCRHFLIITTDSGEYKLLGSYQSFSTLTSLIHHHGHAPITKAGNEVLIKACPPQPSSINNNNFRIIRVSVGSDGRKSGTDSDSSVQ